MSARCFNSFLPHATNADGSLPQVLTRKQEAGSLSGMDKHLRHRINAARVAVEKQIPFFRKQFGRVDSEWKADDTRVTFVDFAISEKIVAELRRSFPGDDFCSEEGNPADEVLRLEASFAWVLDPVDGTNNYVRGLPSCAISLGLLRQGLPVYGYVYDYARDRLLEGGPAYGLRDGLIKRKLPETVGKQGIVALSFPMEVALLDKLRPLLEGWRVRSFGSGTLSLAYAASGLVDGVIDTRVKVWDIAAGVALLEGAGGQFCSLAQSPFPLQHFHVNGPRTPYYAGSAGFCAEVGRLLREV